MIEKISIVRIETETDLRQCAEVLVDAYNNEPWNDQWTNEKAFEKLHCFFCTPKFIGYYCLLESEVIAGYVGNIEPYYTGDYFYLKEMFVKSTYQNMGIGKTLLKHLDDTLSILEIQAQILMTGKETPAFQLYKKNGFTEFESMKLMSKRT